MEDYSHIQVSLNYVSLTSTAKALEKDENANVVFVQVGSGTDDYFSLSLDDAEVLGYRLLSFAKHTRRDVNIHNTVNGEWCVMGKSNEEV